MKSLSATLPVDAAKRTLADFIEAIYTEDYETAKKNSQITWLTSNRVDHLQAKSSDLSRAFRLVGIIRNASYYRFFTPKQCSPVFYTIPFGLFDRNTTRFWFGYANVICETGYRQPSLDGTWGVNPTSMLRNFNNTVEPSDLVACSKLTSLVR